MAVIREAGEAFMKRPEVHPVWPHQLTVPSEQVAEQSQEGPNPFQMEPTM